MLYRAFRRKAGGAWLSALITTEKDSFRVLPEEHAAQVAKGYGLSADAIAVVDADADPRVSPLVMPRLPQGNADPLAKTLVEEIEAQASAAGIALPPQFLATLRRRLRERLEGTP